MGSPDDFSGLLDAFRRIDINKIRRIAVIGKTEGSTGRNDFSRHIALSSLDYTLRQVGGSELAGHCVAVFSTGCEGVACPFAYLLLDVADEGSNDASPASDASPRLAFGGATTPPIESSQLGTDDHARLIAEATTAAMEGAGLDKDDVDVVLVKSPVAAKRTSKNSGEVGLVLEPGHARGIGALGVGLALGEFETGKLEPGLLRVNGSRFSTRALAVSGSESDRGAVIVLGNSSGSTSPFVVHSTHISDIVDALSTRRALIGAGMTLRPDGEIEGLHNIAAAFLKVGINSDGRVRGNRTTVFSSELDPGKHMRAAASGMIGSILGSVPCFVSAGTEHQAEGGQGLFVFVTKES